MNGIELRSNGSGAGLATAPVGAHETATAAAVAAAEARIKAATYLALQRPRDVQKIHRKLVEHCQRPAFAEAALYYKPVGDGGIEGLSVRFAETAMLEMGNLHPSTAVVYDDQEKRHYACRVMDLESNVFIDDEVVVEKTVERKKPRRGEQPLRTRTNRYGDTVYVFPATDEEIINKANALKSKAFRGLILRLLPAETKEECERTCNATLEREAKRDPAKERQGLLVAFDRVGVKVADLEKYLGHPFAEITPLEITELKRVGVALKDGEASWTDQLEEKLARVAPRITAPPTTTTPPVAEAAKTTPAPAADASQASPPAPPPTTDAPASESSPAAGNPSPTPEPASATGPVGEISALDQILAKMDESETKDQLSSPAIAKGMAALPPDEKRVAAKRFNERMKELVASAKERS